MLSRKKFTVIYQTASFFGWKELYPEGRGSRLLRNIGTQLHGDTFQKKMESNHNGHHRKAWYLTHHLRDFLFVIVRVAVVLRHNKEAAVQSCG